MRNPNTWAEWQEAVDIAHGFTLLESARLYGLVTGGPKVDMGRCEFILAQGKRRGIVPDDDRALAMITSLAANQ